MKREKQKGFPFLISCIISICLTENKGQISNLKFLFHLNYEMAIKNKFRVQCMCDSTDDVKCLPDAQIILFSI